MVERGVKHLTQGHIE